MDRRRMILGMGTAAGLLLAGNAWAAPWRRAMVIFLKPTSGKPDRDKVASALKATAGVVEVVTAEAAATPGATTKTLVRATVTYDARKTDRAKVVQAMKEAGYELARVDDRGRGER